MEDAEEAVPVDGTKLTFAFKPYEIKTFRVHLQE